MLLLYYLDLLAFFNIELSLRQLKFLIIKHKIQGAVVS